MPPLRFMGLGRGSGLGRLEDGGPRRDDDVVMMLPSEGGVVPVGKVRKELVVLEEVQEDTLHEVGIEVRSRRRRWGRDGGFHRRRLQEARRQQGLGGVLRRWFLLVLSDAVDDGSDILMFVEAVEPEASDVGSQGGPEDEVPIDDFGF